MNLRVLTACGLLGLVFQAAPLAAEPFWTKLVPSKRVDADPNREYEMTQHNGPWMILATSFSGEGAEDQARELVIELRRRYKLEAYMHEMTFDFSDGVAGIGVDSTGQPLRMQYQKDDVIKEIAVLVGNFPTIDDPQAQATLRKIKFMRPDCLTPKDRDSTSQSLAALRTIQKAILPEGDARKKKGPMGHALVTRNPMIPREYFVPDGIDAFVEKINSDVKYSLLKCPGKFTVKVATFTGKVVLDQHEIQQYEAGKPLPTQLEVAGLKAETLATALRAKGYEAYVLHDRNMSIVTVGSFDTVGTPQANGTIELLPQIHAIMKTFGAQPRTMPPSPTKGPQQSQTAFEPRSLNKIPFDVQPQIVQIPRRSISRDYSQR